MCPGTCQRRQPVRRAILPAGSRPSVATSMTPVCTETPNHAGIPTPDETLKFVCVSSARSPPTAPTSTFTRISSAHLNDYVIFGVGVV